jgi:hypothetical protein
MAARRVRNDRRNGRVEAALERSLIERKDIGAAQRAQLRAQARAVDVAEAMADPDLVTTASRAYLEALVAAGLTAGGAKPVDAVDAFLAGLLRAGAGGSDTPQP